MTWLCSCGLRNSGLNQQCAGLNQSILGCSEHTQISSNSPDYLMFVVASRELGLVGRNGMTNQEELYVKFYNKGKLLVADMDVTQLREHRETLAQIAFEAKATLAAADDELRERKAKSSVKAKEWLVTPTGPDQTTSDAINAVKVRKERMSKMDKMKAQLLSAGIDEATVNEMIASLERKATEKNLKTVSFTKPATETAVVTVQVAKPVPQDNGGESKAAFNPSTLSFGGSK